MQVCFIGHRTVKKDKELITSLKQIVLELINKGATTFLFGSMSEFDDMALKVVTELKANFSFIKRVYVRAAYQHIDKSYENYLLKFYEETYFPQKLEKAGRCSYVERNYEMIDRSTYCVFYYDENYVPLSGQCKRNILSKSKRKSGTKIAYNYAVKKSKKIINLYK